MAGNSPRARDTRPDIVFEDGLGPRYRWAAATARPEHVGIEMHLLRASVAGAPAFEFALRERVARLARFHHPSFSTVHGVERGQGNPPELLLFADAGAGMRLSVLLEDAYTSGIPLDCDAALCILRQLVDAIAALHTFGLDVSHGAISAERLHLAAPDRLLVADHALASALQRLQYPAAQYWSELGVAVPSQPQPPVFDQRLDVVQIGALVVALLRGYPLEVSEWGDLAEALGSTRASTAAGDTMPLPPGIRGWLARALQLNPLYSFSSAVDAKAALDALLEESGGADRSHLTAFLSRCFGELEPFWSVDEEYPRPLRSAEPADTERRYVEPVSHPDVRAREAAAIAEGATSEAPVDAAVTIAEPEPSTDLSYEAAVSPEPVTDETPAFVSLRIEPLTVELSEVAPTEIEYAHVEAPDQGAPCVESQAIERQAIEPPVEQLTVQPPEGEPFGLVVALTDEAWPRITRDGKDSANGSDEPPPEPDLQGIDARLATSPIEVIVRTTFEPEAAPVRQRARWIGGFLGLFCVGATSGVVFAWNEPARVSPLALGRLELSSTPVGADAYVNNAYRGLTPLTIVLPPGAHVIEVRGETARRLRIVVSPGLTLSQFVDLPSSGQPVTMEHALGGASDVVTPGSMVAGSGFIEPDADVPGTSPH